MGRRLSPAEITLIVIDAVLIIVLIVLLIARPINAGEPAGADTSPPSSTADASSSETESAAPSSTQAVAAPDGALDIAEFVAPSRNIWCNLTESKATCQIQDIDYQVPVINGCDDNEIAGRVIAVSASGAEYPCPGGNLTGTAVADRPVLEYEDVTVVGDTMCLSTKTGVTCTNLSTGSSFTLTRRGPSLDN